MIETIQALSRAGMAVTPACRQVGLARATYYRRDRGYTHYRPVKDPVAHRDRVQPAALSQKERDQIVTALSKEEHAERSVVQVYWAEFDAGTIACSQRTFYRVAAAHHLVGDLRPTNRRSPSSRRTPAVAATRVGDLWSWDVTELRGPGRDRYFLYLALDVFSRYPVGWCIEHSQTTERAREMFTTAIHDHGPPRTIHADNGSIQRAHDLIADLHKHGAVTSYSRPRVSDDNPFSESLFKTIKYDPTCPEQFQSLDHAREWTQNYLHQYATTHRHSALGRHTPHSVHTGTAHQIHQQRQTQLEAYWNEHPNRFRRRPTPPPLPQTTGINTHLLSQQG
ncbi:IS3 family transposase [Georgenia sp. M64]|uniref:IS3 family transposase n=1 Tax=Georgenia sp. M64 TaxID=3120520 RepID=UPI0030E3446D